MLLVSRDKVTGSSPRVRGAVDVLHAHVDGHGIIPARAGSSTEVFEFLADARDHPRACGEQHRPGRLSGGSRGSSPRVRGAEEDADEVQQGLGIIPARAGSRNAKTR